MSDIGRCTGHMWFLQNAVKMGSQSVSGKLLEEYYALMGFGDGCCEILGHGGDTEPRCQNADEVVR